MNEHRFESCNTCQSCILDIGVGAYICVETSHIICEKGKLYDLCKPTNCNLWQQSK